MFTGLVQDLGSVINIETLKESARIQIQTVLVPQIKLGDSVSVNGVCLTAVEVDENSFIADVMVQTLRLTALADLTEKDLVNLELAAQVDGRLGGHIVQGHVDGVATVVSNQPGERWNQFVITVPQPLTKYIVNQGSITVDGVSLTVGEVDDQSSALTLWLIPETLAKTNLGSKNAGNRVNVEVDILAKYVERLLDRKSAQRLGHEESQ